MKYQYEIKCVVEKIDGQVSKEIYTINSNMPLWTDTEEDRNKIRSFLTGKENNVSVCIVGLKFIRPVEGRCNNAAIIDSFALNCRCNLTPAPLLIKREG